MNSPNDGGPAFPTTMPGFNKKGMSLRDYFAASLVSGLALNCGDGCVGYMEQRAKVAYAFADEMIKARESAIAKATKGTQ